MSVISNNQLAGAAGQGGADAGYKIERSLRFNSADSAYLNRTPSSAGNRKTWTWSGWVKRYSTGIRQIFFSCWTGSTRLNFGYLDDDRFEMGTQFAYILKSNALFRDPAAWQHWVVSVDTTLSSNRCKVYLNGSEITSWNTNSFDSTFAQNADTDINQAAVHYIGQLGTGTSYLNAGLADVHFIDGQALAPTDFGEYDDNGVWQPKETNISPVFSGPNKTQNWNSLWTGTIYGSPYAFSNVHDTSIPSVGDTVLNSNSVLPANNQSLVLTPTTPITVNTSVVLRGSDGGATGADKLFVINAGRTDEVAFYQKPSGSGFRDMTATAAQVGGKIYTITLNGRGGGGGNSAYLGSIFVDGRHLQTGGPVADVSNTFHLNFSDNSSNAALGTDSSGNSNTWTVNNLSVASGAGNDSLIDTPTNYAASGNNGGNYATLNPLDTNASTSDGNLRVTHSSYNDAPVTIPISSGKWYMEATCESVGSSSLCGFTKASNSGKDHTAVDSYRIIYEDDGNIYREGTGLGNTSGVATYTANDLIGIAINMDNGTISFYKNNTLINTSTSTSAIGNVEWKFYTSGNGNAWVINMGQRPFAYTPPTGYKSLCTTNLPNPTIADGSNEFNAVLRNGFGTSGGTVTVGFSPGLLWEKTRSSAGSHSLYDAVRGAGKILNSNNTNAETTDTDQVNAFTSTGYTLGTNEWGTSTTLVGWAWNAGSSTVSNTDGSISSSVRANPSAGFSIITYTGNGSAHQSIGHGLNAAPKLYIQKRTDSTSDWGVTTNASGTLQYIPLNSTNTAITSSANSPTSSVVYISGSGAGLNVNGATYVTYCFTPVEGYSAFGSYTGNGSSDGTFVFTGFRPAFLMIKRTDTSENWEIRDSTRNPHNRTNLALFPHTSGAEDTGSVDFDFLSNGFKLRNTNGSTNASGGTYIYAAFAEHPFKTARAR